MEGIDNPMRGRYPGDSKQADTPESVLVPQALPTLDIKIESVAVAAVMTGGEAIQNVLRSRRLLEEGINQSRTIFINLIKVLQVSLGVLMDAQAERRG